MNDQTGSGDANPSQRNEAVPPDLYAARVTGSRETLAKLMQTFELEIAVVESVDEMCCRPSSHTAANRAIVQYHD